MGRLAKIIEFFRSGDNTSKTKANLGGGQLLNSVHLSAPGDDSFPLPDDYVALIETSGNGVFAAVGYADTENAPLTVIGEKRIYARSESGEVVADIHLFNDKSVTLKNENGFMTLQPNGDLNLNGVIIDIAGHIYAPGGGQFLQTLKAEDKEIIEHLHKAGTPPGTTGPNL